MNLSTLQITTLLQINGYDAKTIFSIANYVSINENERVQSLDDLLDLITRLSREHLIGEFPSLNLDVLIAAESIAKQILERSKEQGISIVSYYDEGYPENLRNVIDKSGKSVSPLLSIDVENESLFEHCIYITLPKDIDLVSEWVSPHCPNLIIKIKGESAEQGYAAAQYDLANAYRSGNGVKQDDMLSAYWFLKAAKLGFGLAQFEMGYIYDMGEVVKKDVKEAIKWYQKAAEQGIGDAQFNLGLIYANGSDGVKIDLEQAVVLFMKAAKQGDKRAQFSMGRIYQAGVCVVQDYTEAVAWYHKSAEQGFTKAQYSLGVMYRNGKGVAKDTEEADKWYRKSKE